MTTVVYSDQMRKNICIHEDSMLETYMQTAKKFEPLFYEKGYQTKMGLVWKNSHQDHEKFERMALKDGYECYFFCDIDQNGEVVLVASDDGEADYYPMSASWPITVIYRRWASLWVDMYTSTDDADIEATMKNLLFLLRRAEKP